ncbi:hypothetical protein Tco_1126000 [Tanacetum coccineum]
MIARRVTDDLIAFSGETAPRRYMKYFLTQKLAESRHFVNRMHDEADTLRDCVAQMIAVIGEHQAMSDQDEVHDSLSAAKDAKRSEESKLVALNDVIAEALANIETQETNVEILDDENNGKRSALVADLGRSYVPIGLRCEGNSRLLNFEVVSAVMELVNLIVLVLTVMSIMKWIPAKWFSCSLGLIAALRCWNGPLEIYIYTLSLKVLTMATLYILDKLAEVADSSRLQDKMKVVFVEARVADESFIALIGDLCSALRVSITKNRRLIAELETLGQQGEALKLLDYMKEIVARDSATLRVLEQLLAGTHVGMRLKASYVAEMEETK